MIHPEDANEIAYMLQDIGIDVEFPEDAMVGYQPYGIEFQPMSDREVLEAHGYDVEATAVDRFFNAPLTLRLDYAEAMRAPY